MRSRYYQRLFIQFFSQIQSIRSLARLVNKNAPVRISGWLLYDYEHVPVIGTQRASVWEIHPITKIEVKKNGQWVDLDQ